MIIISYDIKDDKLRTRFSKMLCRHGAIRLQFSVYEVNNTKRIIENIKIEISEKYSELFTPADSVVIFEASIQNVMKFGNAIHRDRTDPLRPCQNRSERRINMNVLLRVWLYSRLSRDEDAEFLQASVCAKVQTIVKSLILWLLRKAHFQGWGKTSKKVLP